MARTLAIALMSVNAIACGARGAAETEATPMWWSGYAGTITRAVSAGEAVPPEPTALWEAAIGRLASGPPALGPDVVIVMGTDRWLTALDRTNGRRRWRSRLNAGGTADVVVTDGRLFVATGGFEGRVYRYRLRDGRRMWDREVGRIAGGLAVVNDHVIAVTEGGGVVALDTERGTVAWRQRVQGPVRGGVTPLGNAVLIATFDSLFVLDAVDGTIRARTGSPAVLGTPAVAGAVIVMGSPDGVVAGLSFDLVELWRVTTAGGVIGGTAVARDTAFAVTNRGGLYRIPLAAPMTYDSVMLERPVVALPAPVATGVLIGTAGGEVVFVGAGAPGGRTLFRVDGPILHPPVVRDRTIYVADGRGKVAAWR
ncbi:MAG: PQQ-binding-like beta-propeller repeat protein [Gemmatimonadales bacterium]